MVGSPTIPTASNLTRTKVRELIDGFAEHIFWMARWKTVLDGLSIGASRWPALLKLNEKALAVPGGCNEPEFGPCALVTATLRTDWGPSRSSGPHLQCHVGIEDFRAGAVRKFPQPENDLDM